MCPPLSDKSNRTAVRGVQGARSACSSRTSAVDPVTSAREYRDCVRLYQIGRIVQRSVAYKEQDLLALRVQVYSPGDLRGGRSCPPLQAEAIEAPECRQTPHVGVLEYSASVARHLAFAGVDRERAQRGGGKRVSGPLWCAFHQDGMPFAELRAARLRCPVCPRRHRGRMLCSGWTHRVTRPCLPATRGREA
jgi:hypothetical protein